MGGLLSRKRRLSWGDLEMSIISAPTVQSSLSQLGLFLVAPLLTAVEANIDIAGDGLAERISLSSVSGAVVSFLRFLISLNHIRNLHHQIFFLSLIFFLSCGISYLLFPIPCYLLLHLFIF